MAETSEVAICNSALGLLKEDAIINLTDDNIRAKNCNKFYARERDALLRVYPANFSTTRAVLNQSTNTPAWGFSYAYPLPSDYIRFIEMQDGNIYAHKIEWVVDALCLVTDASTVKIKYTRAVTDVNSMDELFKRWLGHRMATLMAYPITGKRSLAMLMKELEEEVEMEAMNVDSQEGTSDTTETDDYINVRHGSSWAW